MKSMAHKKPAGKATGNRIEQSQWDGLFDEWSDLNDVVCDWRARFSDLREGFPQCRSLKQVREFLEAEEFGDRYPRLPRWLLADRSGNNDSAN